MCAEVRRSDAVEDRPPNCPPTSVLLVRKMKFLAKHIRSVFKEVAAYP